MDIVEVSGNRVLRLQRESKRKLVSVWIVDGWEIIIDGKLVRRGFTDGEFDGLSCGRGRAGEKWGQNGGKSRMMSVASTDDTVSIRIKHPTTSSGDSITVAHSDLRTALAQLFRQ
jgi:hypothetical protein